jgi:amidase
MFLDEPDVYDGAPVGIQMIARKYEEEKIWAIGKIVHDILLKEGYGKGREA